MAGGGTATGGATAGGTAVAAGTATALATGGAAAFRLGGTGGVVNAGSFRGSSISPFALQTPTMSFPTQGAYNQMLLQQQYQIQQRILAERAADARRAALRQHRAQLAAARAERLAKEAELKATGKKPAKTGSTAARSRVQPVDRPEADDAVAPTTSATAVQSPRPTTTARL